MIFAQQIIPPASGENWAIGAILALLILREVFGFLKGRTGAGDPTQQAITSIAENLVELRKTEEAERELLLALQYGQANIREDTLALRAMGHSQTGQQQAVIARLDANAKSLEAEFAALHRAVKNRP